jgi:predicted nucleotidyltransferase
MRELPSTLDPIVVAEIDDRITRLQREHRVAVPWAIESGSRAWGFPSPDSDYDCRFLFVRSADSYLTPWPERDVIETPLDAVFDVNGWDLIKAVRLLLKGNATVTEWLRSPIVYTGDTAFRDAFLELADAVGDRAIVGRHYLHVGSRQLEGDRNDLPLKRVFYALRPAAALRWLRLNPRSLVPPMDLPTLLVQSEMPRDVLAESEDLIALKAVTHEIGRGSVPPAIDRFITDEFETATELYEDARALVSAESQARAAEFFRSAVREFGPR